MSGYRVQGTDTDALFDPDTVGDGPAVALYTGGTPMRYAALKYGSKRADIGYRNGGLDVSNYWAAKGTASYALACNGKSYSDNNQSRGQAGFRFLVSANGTWQIQRWRSTSLITTVESGTWLPAGDSAANWSCNFDYSITNQSTPGGGSNGVDCDSPNNGSQYGLTADHYCRVYAQATLTGQNATSNGTIVLHLFRGGALRSTTTIYTYQNVNGN